MGVNHAPEPDETPNADVDSELDDEATEGHGVRAFEVGEAETAVNRDIDPQSSRPQ